MAFKIDRIPHFKIKPAAGRLLPHQSMDLLVSFAPNQLGAHKGRFTVTLSGGQGHPVGAIYLDVAGVCDREGRKVTLPARAPFRRPPVRARPCAAVRPGARVVEDTFLRRLS